MIGPHQSIILRFVSTEHGAAACSTTFCDDRSYLLRTSSGSFSMRTNIVGHPLRVRDVVLLDQRERLLGIEVLHHDDGAAEAHRAHRIEQRRRVVQRRGRQVDAVAVHARRPPSSSPISTGCSPTACRCDLVLHALRPPRRARRVEHPRALELLRERLGRDTGRARPRRARSRRPACRRPSSRILTRGILSTSSRRDVAKRVADDEHLRVAVVEDVRDLVRVEVRVDAREEEPGALRRPTRLEVLDAGSP